MTTPARLYKYIPSAFVNKFLKRGDLLFRNLAYFRQIEEAGRGDLLEGLHMDYPDNDVTMSTADGRVRWQGRAAFLNSVDANKLFVFCFSEILSPALYTEFKADTCIEIFDPVALIRRCRGTIARQVRFSESALLCNQVEYYAPNKPVKRNTKDPSCIPFFKHEAFSHQQEFRFAAALRRGLQVTQRIVNEAFTFEEEVATGKAAYRHVVIGSIEDITRVHNMNV